MLRSMIQTIRLLPENGALAIELVGEPCGDLGGHKGKTLRVLA